MKLNSRIMAILAVLAALCIVLPSVAISEPEEQAPVLSSSEEFEVGELATLAIVGTLALLGATGVLGGVIGHHFAKEWYEGQLAKNDRQAAAEQIATVLGTNINTAKGFSEQIASMLPFTQEHFIRSAELASRFQWSPNADYNPQEIMDVSGIYDALNILIANSYGGFSQILDLVSIQLDEWNGEDTYKDKMTISFLYGTTVAMSSKSAIKGEYLPVAVPTDGFDKVYLSGSYLYVDGGSAAITRADGYRINLVEGYNELGPDFKSGIYTLQKDRIYAGYILPSTSLSSPIRSGIIVQAGMDIDVAYLANDGMGIVVNDTTHESISIKIATTDGYSVTNDIGCVMPILETAYSEIRAILNNSISSSEAVWNIYDRAGQANAYITTLSVPDYYNNVELSAAEKEVITILAMEQMAKYYNDNQGAIKKGEYKLSQDSAGLYCLGDIMDSKGNVIASNVIFTPFFYVKDTTLYTATNTTSQYGLVAIWKENAISFSGWDGTANLTEATLMDIPSGYKLVITDMIHEGQPVSSVKLDVAEIELVVWDRYEIDPDYEDNKDDGTDWKLISQVIIILLGAAMLVYGLITRSMTWIIRGVVVILIGLLVVPLIFKAAGIISSWRLPW